MTIKNCLVLIACPAHGGSRATPRLLDRGGIAEWRGELAYSPLGVLAGPAGLRARVAARGNAPRRGAAVTVLPLHHPIRVAEQWATLDLLSGGRVDFAAGRGYDRREYLPLNVSFEHNQEIFEEGMEVVRRLWSADRPISHHGRHYRFDDVAITPKPVQRPAPAYVAPFSQPSIELAGRLGCGLIVAPFAAAMTYGGLSPKGRPDSPTLAPSISARSSPP